MHPIKFHVILGAGRVGTAAALSTLVEVYQRHLQLRENSVNSSSEVYESVLLVDNDVETVQAIRHHVSKANIRSAASVPVSVLPLTHTFNKGRVGGAATHQATAGPYGVPSGVLAALIPHYEASKSATALQTESDQTEGGQAGTPAPKRKAGVFDVLGSTVSRSSTLQKAQSNTSPLPTFPMLTSCTLSEFEAMLTYIQTENKCDEQPKADEWISRHLSSSTNSPPVLSIASLTVATHMTNLKAFRGLKWHYGKGSYSSTGASVFRGLFDGKDGNSDSKRLAVDQSQETLVRNISKAVSTIQATQERATDLFIFTRGLSELRVSPRAVAIPSSSEAPSVTPTAVNVVVGPIYPEAWAHESCCLLEHLRRSEIKSLQEAQIKAATSPQRPHNDDQKDELHELFNEKPALGRFDLPPKSGTLFSLEQLLVGTHGDAKQLRPTLYRREAIRTFTTRQGTSKATNRTEEDSLLLVSELVNALAIVAPVAAGILTSNPIQYSLVPPIGGTYEQSISKVGKNDESAAIGANERGSILDKGVTFGKRSKKQVDTSSTNSQADLEFVAPQFASPIVPLCTTPHTTANLSATVSRIWRTFSSLLWLEDRFKDATVSSTVILHPPPPISVSMASTIEATLTSAIQDSTNKGFIYGRRYATFGTIGGSVGGAFAPDSPELHALESTSDALQKTCEDWEIAIMVHHEEAAPNWRKNLQTADEEPQNGNMRSNITVAQKHGIKPNDMNHLAKVNALRSIADGNSNELTIDDIEVATAALNQLLSTHRGITTTVINHMKSLRRSDHIGDNDSVYLKSKSTTTVTDRAQKYWALSEDDTFKNSKTYSDVRSVDYAALSGSSDDEFNAAVTKLEDK